MNTLDIIFLIMIGVSILYSFVRGLVREIFSFLSIIFGFLGAVYGCDFLTAWLKRWITNGTLAYLAAFALLFVVVALSVGFLGRLLSHLAHKGGLGWADRMGGAAFGLLKAVFLVAVIVFVLTAFLPPRSRILLDSRLAPPAMSAARGLAFLVPAKIQELYSPREKELRKYWAAREISPSGGKKR